MKQVTFTVYDCGCVIVDSDTISSDGFELLCVCWFALSQISDNTPNISESNAVLGLTEVILANSIDQIKRSPKCITRHKKSNAN